jgi:hypothetical protein
MCISFFNKKFFKEKKIEERSFIDGSIEYYLGDDLHNTEGPAVISDGHKEWWIHGLRHRENGPAIEHADGSTEYYYYGMKHRVNKPAIMIKDQSFNFTLFTHEYWFYGKLHREKGPAVLKSDGSQEYWIHGKRIK